MNNKGVEYSLRTLLIVVANAIIGIGIALYYGAIWDPTRFRCGWTGFTGCWVWGRITERLPLSPTA